MVHPAHGTNKWTIRFDWDVSQIFKIKWTNSETFPAYQMNDLPFGDLKTSHKIQCQPPPAILISRVSSSPALLVWQKIRILEPSMICQMTWPAQLNHVKTGTPIGFLYSIAPWNLFNLKHKIWQQKCHQTGKCHFVQPFHIHVSKTFNRSLLKQSSQSWPFLTFLRFEMCRSARKKNKRYWMGLPTKLDTLLENFHILFDGMSRPELPRTHVDVHRVLWSNKPVNPYDSVCCFHSNIFV